MKGKRRIEIFNQINELTNGEGQMHTGGDFITLKKQHNEMTSGCI